MDSIDNPTLNHHFWQPLRSVLDRSRSIRQCSKYKDAAHLKSGVARVLHPRDSGRGWVQNLSLYFSQTTCAVGNFFDALKSKRRLAFVAEMDDALAAETDARVLADGGDPFAEHKELEKFHLYATDGHSLAASAHELPIKGKKRAVNHIFSLSLRSHSLHYIDLCNAQGKQKKEHEIKKLKSLQIATLRMGAPKGTKVIHAYDPAIVDYVFWRKCKQSGIYFITLEKANSTLLKCGDLDYDREDPRNEGVLANELVGPSNGEAIRRVVYRDAESGKTYTFLTAEMTLPPGIIAFLYKCRWDIEKVFDQSKNKLGEGKAWAKSPTAKKQQARFICMAHNLILLLSLKLEQEEGIADEKSRRHRARRKEHAERKAELNSLTINSLVRRLNRSTQRCLQFIRWLRISLIKKLSYSQALQELRPLMLRYLR
jgi:hypothetical protein